jgi:hypothetical protein
VGRECKQQCIYKCCCQIKSQYATEAAKILGITPDADWMNVANNIPILKLDNGVTKEHAAIMVKE